MNSYLKIKNQNEKLILKPSLITPPISPPHPALPIHLCQLSRVLCATLNYSQSYSTGLSTHIRGLYELSPPGGDRQQMMVSVCERERSFEILMPEQWKMMMM